MIANANRDPQNIWHRIHAPIAQSLAIHAQASVGSSASTSKNYDLTIVRARTGAVRLFHDVGTATTSWSCDSGNILVSVGQNSATGDAIVGVETMIPFAWNGASSGVVPKTGKFF